MDFQKCIEDKTVLNRLHQTCKDLITCPICYQIFKQEYSLRPIVSCEKGHTLCQGCFNRQRAELTVDDKQRQIKCHMCRSMNKIESIRQDHTAMKIALCIKDNQIETIQEKSIQKKTKKIQKIQKASKNKNKSKNKAKPKTQKQQEKIKEYDLTNKLYHGFYKNVFKTKLVKWARSNIFAQSNWSQYYSDIERPWNVKKSAKIVAKKGMFIFDSPIYENNKIRIDQQTIKRNLEDIQSEIELNEKTPYGRVRLGVCTHQLIRNQLFLGLQVNQDQYHTELFKYCVFSAFVLNLKKFNIECEVNFVSKKLKFQIKQKDEKTKKNCDSTEQISLQDHLQIHPQQVLYPIVMFEYHSQQPQMN